MSVKHFQIAAFSILLFLIIYTPWPNKDETFAFLQSTGTDDIYNYVTGELPNVKESSVPWDVFDHVGEIKVHTEDKKTGFEEEYFKPDYTDKIKALDGKTIRLMGFMFPLSPTMQQTDFLFGPYALSCPFHYHVSPRFVIEALTPENKPIKFSYDPMVIEGTFDVKFDKETQVFYYLRNAKLIKMNP